MTNRSLISTSFHIRIKYILTVCAYIFPLHNQREGGICDLVQHQTVRGDLKITCFAKFGLLSKHLSNALNEIGIHD